MDPGAARGAVGEELEQGDGDGDGDGAWGNLVAKRVKRYDRL